MRAHHVTFPFLLLLASACTKADSSVVDLPLEPAAPASGQQLASSTFTLHAAEEKYMCYQFYAPDQAVAITHVTAIEQVGVHHLALFQAYGRDETPVTPHECDTLIRQTWMPIFVTGGGTKEMVMPDHVGLVIQPGTQYILQLHLQNTGDSDLDVRAGVNLTYDFAVDQITPGGIFAIGKQSFTVPATTPDFTIPVDCTVNQTMNVFAEFPHMHKIGKALTTTKAGADGVPADFYSIDPWSFGNQPIDQIPKQIAPGDKIHLECHFDNETSTDVLYGESSDNEMCYFVLYYYPYDHLDGCIEG